jgi:HEAT repeat protein
MHRRKLDSYKLPGLTGLALCSCFVCITGCESAASRSIDVLRTANGDTDARISAIRQVQADGKETVLRAKPELIQALDNSAPPVQRAAEEALITVGPDVAEDLIKVGGDASRRAAVLEILRQTAVGNSVLEQVIGDSKKGEYTDRLHATELLGALAAKNNPALTQLGQLISDQDPLIRVAAIEEAAELGPSAGPTLAPALIGALDDRITAVREAACMSLGSLGPSAIQAKSALERIGKGHDAHLAEMAQIVLGTFPASTPGQH